MLHHRMRYRRLSYTDTVLRTADQLNDVKLAFPNALIRDSYADDRVVDGSCNESRVQSPRIIRKD